MVTKTGLIRLSAVAAALATAAVASATVVSSTATLTETSSAPTGTVIAANLPSSGITASGNPNYYTGTQISPMPGEIFTTGNTATSITNVVVNLADAGNVAQGPNSSLYLYLGTASGTNAFTGTTYEYGVTKPSSFFTKGGYLNFTLATPFTVSANTQYAYVVSGNPYSAAGGAGNSGTYMGLGAVVTNGNGTASQGLGLFAIDSGLNSPTANAAYNTYSGSTKLTGAGGTDNAVFEALGTAGTSVPEPSTLALAFISVLGMGLLLKPRKTA